MFVAPVATTGGTAHKLMSIAATDPELAKICKGGGKKWRATNCKSGALKDLVNEAFGQGEAKATTLGVATMLARLAAAARGVENLRRPYLVEAITDAKGKPMATAATRSEDGSAVALTHPEPTQVRPDVAKKVFDALALGTAELSGQEGTGRLICRHVFGAECGKVGKQIAGKTGTPSYSLDKETLESARKHCLTNPRDADCLEKPVKWYVAAYKTSASDTPNYDKVIAVMSERNWYLASKDVPKGLQGRIHGVNDLNNISTEIAMRALGAGLLNLGGR
jgi:cell division protein FtsI/penicillin-binding protein 2